MEAKTKFALVMFVSITGIAILFRLFWYVKPADPLAVDVQATENVNTLETSVFDELEEELENITVDNVTDKTLSQYTAIEPTNSQASVMQHRYRAQLGAGVAPSLFATELGFDIAYATDMGYVLQQYASDYQPIGEPKQLVEQLPSWDSAVLVPELAANQSHYFILTHLVENETVSANVIVMDRATHEVVNEFVVIASSIQTEDVRYHLEQSQIAVDQTNLYIATPVNTSDISLVHYTLSGELITEHILETAGTLIAVIADKGGPVILTQSDNELRFTKVTDDAVQRFAVSVTEDITVQKFAYLGSYVAAITHSTMQSPLQSSLAVWSENLQTVYPTVSIDQLVTYPALLYKDNRAYLAYSVAETSLTNIAEEITTHTLYLDEYEIDPLN